VTIVGRDEKRNSGSVRKEEIEQVTKKAMMDGV